MPKDKAKKGGRKKKEGKKSSQLAIRLEKAERDDFVDLCEKLDTSAAREIRRFMREFVASHAASQAPQKEPESAEVTEPVPPAPAAKTPTPAVRRTRKPPAGKAPADAAPAAKPRAATRVKKMETTPSEDAAPAPRRTRRSPRAKAGE